MYLPVIPLYPNFYIQILQIDLHTFSWRIGGEDLVNDQSIFPLMIIDFVLKNWCSLLFKKGKFHFLPFLFLSVYAREFTLYV